MTYKQSQSVGARVRGGEQGTRIQYWKITDQVPVKDANGRPMLDAEGSKVYRTVEFDKPGVFSAVVFSAEQIDGLPPLEVKTSDRDRYEWAESVLKASGVEIRHDQADRAFYRPATDKIHLPRRDSFKSADIFYSIALHELAHYADIGIRATGAGTPLGWIGILRTPSAASAMQRKSCVPRSPP